MKILFVAMTESIHTARWISQVSDQNWDLSLFPSTQSLYIRPEVSSEVLIFKPYLRQKLKQYKSLKEELSFLTRRFYEIKRFAFRMIDFFVIKRFIAKKLQKIIEQEKPDIIHSMEFQHAGYLVNEAKKSFKGMFPMWIATNWGSDIYYFSRFKEHRQKIKEVLQNADYYNGECARDIDLAKKIGLKAKVLPPMSVTGGFDLDLIKKWRKLPVSKRKIIVVKGYQGTWGRALIALKALELSRKYLDGYKIVIYSVDDVSLTRPAAHEFSQKFHIPVEIIPINSSHNDILKLHGQSRILISLSISDGACVSMMEALVMGSFPIQSGTSCANEWFKNGQSGFIVPPEDATAVAKAIKKALTNDKLVDNAAKINWLTVKKRLNQVELKQATVELYQNILVDLSKTANREKINIPTKTSPLKSKIIELMVIIWILVFLFIWCYLIFIYGGQKLNLFNQKTPISNLINEQGQWIWNSDWQRYFLFKK